MGTLIVKMYKTILTCIVITNIGFSIHAQRDDLNLGYARSISLSNNSQYLVVDFSDATDPVNSSIWLYDLGDLLQSPVFLTNTFSSGKTILEFSSNDRFLIIAERNNKSPKLYIFDVESNEPVFYLEGPTTNFIIETQFIAISPDNKFLMTYREPASNDFIVDVWDIERNLIIKSYDFKYPPIISPDWTKLVDTDTKEVFHFDINNGRGEQISNLHSLSPDGFLGLTFSNDNSLVAIGNWNGGVMILDSETWTVIQYIQLHTTPCGYVGLSFAFSFDNSLLASSCDGEEILSVTEIESGDIIFQTQTRGFLPQFSKNNTKLVAYEVVGFPEYTSIFVWDIHNEFKMNKYPGQNALLHSDGELMVTIGPDGNVWIWNIDLAQLQLILPVPQN